MIRERSEIKSIAKQRLAANRGNAVLIYLVTGVIMVGAGTIIPGLGALLATPITVGMMFAFLKIWRDGDGQVNDIFSKLSDYGRMLGGILDLYMVAAVRHPRLNQSPCIFPYTPYISRLSECTRYRSNQAFHAHYQRP